MTGMDLGTRLRAGDPLIDDAAMDAAEVDAMRGAVVAAAGRSDHQPAWWPRRPQWPRWPSMLALVATAAALVIAVVGARMREGSRVAPVKTSTTEAAQRSDAEAPAASGRRQLQFATAGGTRVIWVFDPDFNP